MEMNTKSADLLIINYIIAKKKVKKNDIVLGIYVYIKKTAKKNMKNKNKTFFYIHMA